MGWDNARKALAEGLIDSADLIQKTAFETHVYEQKQNLLSKLRKEEADYEHDLNWRDTLIERGWKERDDKEKRAHETSIQELENAGKLAVAQEKATKTGSTKKPKRFTASEFAPVGFVNELNAAVAENKAAVEALVEFNDLTSEEKETDPAYAAAKRRERVATRNLSDLEKVNKLFDNEDYEGAETMYREMMEARKPKPKGDGKKPPAAATTPPPETDEEGGGILDTILGWVVPDAGAGSDLMTSPQPEGLIDTKLEAPEGLLDGNETYFTPEELTAAKPAPGMFAQGIENAKQAMSDYNAKGMEAETAEFGPRRDANQKLGEAVNPEVIAMQQAKDKIERGTLTLEEAELLYAMMTKQEGEYPRYGDWFSIRDEVLPYVGKLLYNKRMNDGR